MSRDFSRNLGRIRFNESYSDVTISVKGKNYPVHKVILAARSPVFDAMFKSKMQESQNNHITITDIDQDVFEEMISYIYTGSITTEMISPLAKPDEELAYELFPVADKYDLEDLKVMCEETLIRKLSVDNADKILILADMHNAERLKLHTLQFIKRNAIAGNCKNFKDTELWKSLSTSRPELMREMVAIFFE